MKKRILFVDDEPMILDGIKRSTRSLRDVWDMDFVTSGKEALICFSRTPYDVLVTDMRMPEMSGADLLNIVYEVYPNTFRIILSGHADNELIMQCVNSTHQFLSKPCPMDVLIGSIQNVLQLSEQIESTSLRNFVAKVDKLPSVPALYFELIELLQREPTDLRMVASTIAKDMGMTSAILKLTNSAFFGIRRQIADINAAVMYMGTDLIKNLVLSTHIFSQYDEVEMGKCDLDSIWHHSLTVGNLSKMIGYSLGMSAQNISECQVAGMLHDVGKLIFASNFPNVYDRVLETVENRKEENCSKVEQEIFGADHTEVGSHLFGLWGLPEPIVQAVRYHHYPEPVLGNEVTPTVVVYLADTLINAAHHSATIDIDMPPIRLISERIPIVREKIQKWFEYAQLLQKGEV